MHPIRTSLITVWGVAFALALGGCIPSVESTAVKRASIEFECPESQITANEDPRIDDNVTVNACGHVAVYTCPSNRVTRTCVREK